MSLKIPIETSARHIHLSKEDFEILFGTGSHMTYVKELSQPGQYACKERLRVVGPKGQLEKVVVLGPYRKETQVEISVTDTRRLGIPSVIRQSGDLEGTPGCTLIFSDVVVRVSPSFSLAMHVDTDEANAFANDDHPTGVILKLFDGHTYNLQTWADEIQEGIHR